MTKSLTYLRNVAFVLGLAVPMGVRAEPLVVLELFTSQGCSSCPPADSMLHKWVQDPRLLPLALHVDYWDYIGWKDSFGQRAFSDRQRSYVLLHNQKTLYTPQMVINGIGQTQGANGPRILQLIGEARTAQSELRLTLAKKDQKLEISAIRKTAKSPDLMVQIIRYRPVEIVTIEYGENGNKTISYANIVTSWQVVGHWTGAADLHMSVDLEGSDQTAVVLQEPGPARIWAAARLP